MGPDDLDQITTAMKPLMAAAGVPALDKNSIYAFFVDRYVRMCSAARFAAACSMHTA